MSFIPIGTIRSSLKNNENICEKPRLCFPRWDALRLSIYVYRQLFNDLNKNGSIRVINTTLSMFIDNSHSC